MGLPQVQMMNMVLHQLSTVPRDQQTQSIVLQDPQLVDTILPGLQVENTVLQEHLLIEIIMLLALLPIEITVLLSLNQVETNHQIEVTAVPARPMITMVPPAKLATMLLNHLQTVTTHQAM